VRFASAEQTERAPARSVFLSGRMVRLAAPRDACLP
jgi:hypothetical protein